MTSPKVIDLHSGKSLAKNSMEAIKDAPVLKPGMQEAERPTGPEAEMDKNENCLDCLLHGSVSKDHTEPWMGQQISG